MTPRKDGNLFYIGAHAKAGADTILRRNGGGFST